MKKKGRGRDYKKALSLNLLKSLVTYGKITTTKSKAKIVKREILRKHRGVIQLTNLGERKGDNARLVLIERQPAKALALEDKENAKNKSNKKRASKEKVASR